MWQWPEGQQLAITTVIHLDDGEGRPHAAAPDQHYGHHAGFARLARLLDQQQHPASWVVSDPRLPQLPQIAEFIAGRGDQILARARPQQQDEDEAQVIARAAALPGVAQAQTGRGWLGHPMRSSRTAQLLVEHGFDHVLAASPLDQPFHLEVAGSSGLIVQPLLAELSDLELLGVGALSAELWLQALIDSLDSLLEEAIDTGEPRQLCVQLHLPVISRPARIRALQQWLHYLDQQDGIWCTRPAPVAALLGAASS